MVVPLLLCLHSSYHCSSFSNSNICQFNIHDREKLTIDPPLEKLFSYSNISIRPSRRYRDNELLLLKQQSRPLPTVVSMKSGPMQNHSHSRNNNSHSRHNLHNHTHGQIPRLSESSEKSGIIPTRPVLYTVLSKGIGSRSIYQGIIATPPRNPLFLRLIQVIDSPCLLSTIYPHNTAHYPIPPQDFLLMKKPISEEKYHVSTQSFYEVTPLSLFAHIYPVSSSFCTYAFFLSGNCQRYSYL